jgi:hypothetical protein
MTRLTRPLITSLISVSALVIGAWPMAALASTAPGLGTATSFAVLAGTTITNAGPTVVSGWIGASGAGIVGFPPGTSGPQHAGDAVYITAETDLIAAYGAAVQTCTADYSGLNLGGKTLGPGVYCQTTAPTLTGTLTLNGAGVYIFLIGTTTAPTTLVTAPSAKVILIGGAQPCQVFWRVTSSATLATSTQFVGTIMANISIQMQTAATLNGRALARIGAVSLDTNQITAPTTCTPGASEQIADLIQFVTQNQLGPGTSFVDKLQAVQTAIAANDLPGACSTLQAFINEVRAQSGKHLTSDQAAQLITAANRISAVLGC